MADVPPSALSVAAKGVADAIDAHFRRNGAKLHIATDTPIEGAKLANGDTNVVNLFFYRVAPSGFHAAQTSGEPMLIRTYCLVTPFAAKGGGGPDGNGNAVPAGETDLRILGEVLRLFHEHPVLGPFSAPGGANATAYALQSVLLPTDMEEINHIWTALNGETAYRMSATYEFSLVPVDPAQAAPASGPMTGFVAEVDPNTERRTTELDAVATLDGWQPDLRLVDAQGALVEALTLTWSAAAFANNPADPVTLALIGAAGRIAELVWERQVGPNDWEPAVTVQTVVGAARFDDPASRLQPALPQTDAPTLYRLAAWPTDGAGARLPDARPSRTLTLAVEAGP